MGIGCDDRGSLKTTHDEIPNRYTTNSSCEKLLFLPATTAKEIVLPVTSKLPTPTSLLECSLEHNIQQLASNTVTKEKIVGNITDTNDKMVAQSNRTPDIKLPRHGPSNSINEMNNILSKAQNVQVSQWKIIVKHTQHIISLKTNR